MPLYDYIFACYIDYVSSCFISYNNPNYDHIDCDSDGYIRSDDIPSNIPYRTSINSILILFTNENISFHDGSSFSCHDDLIPKISIFK